MIVKLQLNNNEEVLKILNLQLAAYRVEAAIMGFDEIPPFYDTMDTLRTCGETFYGYFIKDTLAGIVSYKLEDKILDIYRVAVHPCFFRRGIADQLLSYIEKLNVSATKIIVSSGRENKPAINLYLKGVLEKVKIIK
jgi:ribosomal protein S18 acetylase RimI-like enzyme